METQKRELVIEDVKGNREVAYALLTSEHPLFVSQHLIEEDGKLTLESVTTGDYYDWQVVASLYDEEKLRHLINIGQLFQSLKDSVYTYYLAPDSLVFSRNAEPLFIFRGIKGQVPPYENMTEESFLNTFKAMAVSLLDKKTSFDGFLNGKLPFYKGNIFCESIAKAETMVAVLDLLVEQYQQEKKRGKENYSRISNKLVFRLKLTSIVTSVLGVLSLAGVLYFLLFAMPRQEMISDLRLAFVNQDYSTVITTVKNTDSKALDQNDKYMVAYSVIMTEPLTEAQKEELSKISAQSNADYLRYWVLVGQSKIDEAMDIASYLDDPQLLMYGLTKKIDEVQRDPDLSSEERTEQLNNYKSKLEELKKTYLTPEETSSTTTTSKNTTTTTESN